MSEEELQKPCDFSLENNCLLIKIINMFIYLFIVFVYDISFLQVFFFFRNYNYCHCLHLDPLKIILVKYLSVF